MSGPNRGGNYEAMHTSKECGVSIFERYLSLWIALAMGAASFWEIRPPNW